MTDHGGLVVRGEFRPLACERLAADVAVLEPLAPVEVGA